MSTFCLWLLLSNNTTYHTCIHTKRMIVWFTKFWSKLPLIIMFYLTITYRITQNCGHHRHKFRKTSEVLLLKTVLFTKPISALFSAKGKILHTANIMPKLQFQNVTNQCGPWITIAVLTLQVYIFLSKYNFLCLFYFSCSFVVYGVNSVGFSWSD